eukprot:Rhum_TRINITY_DN4201_c0_g1::Rhum_TRINITY_DN4201_c0_g1_i1::g.13397::m.13397
MLPHVVVLVHRRPEVVVPAALPRSRRVLPLDRVRVVHPAALSVPCGQPAAPAAALSVALRLHKEADNKERLPPVLVRVVRVLYRKGQVVVDLILDPASGRCLAAADSEAAHVTVKAASAVDLARGVLHVVGAHSGETVDDEVAAVASADEVLELGEGVCVEDALAQLRARLVLPDGEGVGRREQHGAGQGGAQVRHEGLHLRVGHAVRQLVEGVRDDAVRACERVGGHVEELPAEALCLLEGDVRQGRLQRRKEERCYCNGGQRGLDVHVATAAPQKHLLVLLKPCSFCTTREWMWHPSVSALKRQQPMKYRYCSFY